MSDPIGTAPVRAVAGRASRLLAICGKCGRKLGGGFGADGDTPLAKALRRGLGDGKGKRAKVRIVETKCLDLCPKHAVALIDGARPDEVLIIPEGLATPALITRLGLEPAR